MNKDRRKALAEAIDALTKIKDQIENVKSIVETAKDEEREYYDNMPENMQSGDRGQEADTAVSNLEDVFETLDGLDIDDLLSKIDDARGQ